MLEHAAYELLELQLLVLVLVAHVVHLRHHCSQVNLNQIEKYYWSWPDRGRGDWKQERAEGSYFSPYWWGREESCFNQAEFTLIR
jgi:hypothetical protein